MASLAEHLSGPAGPAPPALYIVPKQATKAASIGIFAFGLTTIILSCCILAEALQRRKQSR